MRGGQRDTEQALLGCTQFITLRPHPVILHKQPFFKSSIKPHRFQILWAFPNEGSYVIEYYINLAFSFLSVFCYRDLSHKPLFSLSYKEEESERSRVMNKRMRKSQRHRPKGNGN